MTLFGKEKSCATSVDETWRQLTKLGNDAFAAGDHAVALAHYEEACLEAEAILSAELRAGARGPSIGPMLATIATHDLADAGGGITLRGENPLSSSSTDLGSLPPRAIRGIAYLRIGRDGRISRLQAEASCPH